MCTEDANGIHGTDCGGSTKEEGKHKRTLNICNCREKEEGTSAAVKTSFDAIKSHPDKSTSLSRPDRAAFWSDAKMSLCPARAQMIW